MKSISFFQLKRHETVDFLVRITGHQCGELEIKEHVSDKIVWASDDTCTRGTEYPTGVARITIVSRSGSIRNRTDARDAQD